MHYDEVGGYGLQSAGPSPQPLSGLEAAIHSCHTIADACMKAARHAADRVHGYEPETRVAESGAIIGNASQTCLMAELEALRSTLNAALRQIERL